jgi:hypothetical protein
MGRSGLNTKLGYYPFGSMITKGIYVIENEQVNSGINHEMEFQSFVPFYLNSWNTGYILNDVSSAYYGIGRMQISVFKPVKSTEGLTINHKGSLIFDEDLVIQTSLKASKFTKSLFL